MEPQRHGLFLKYGVHKPSQYMADGPSEWTSRALLSFSKRFIRKHVRMRYMCIYIYIYTHTVLYIKKTKCAPLCTLCSGLCVLMGLELCAQALFAGDLSFVQLRILLCVQLCALGLCAALCVALCAAQGWDFFR